MNEPRSVAQQREDIEIYGCAVQFQPITRMTADEAGELVHLLSNMPTGAGFIISRVIDPIGAPQMFGGCCATVILQGGWTGGAWDNNPAKSFRRAWARAHQAAGIALMPAEEPQK